MIRDSITPIREDTQHVEYSDGHIFHVLGGQITKPGQPCPCQGREPVHQITSYREAVPQLQISLTDACNMGCTYCSFRDRVHADDKPIVMPLEVTRRGVDVFRAETTGADERYGRVDFGLAGETMLVRRLHEDVYRLIEEGLTDTPLAVIWNGPMVTNATLSLSPELADTLGPPQDISLDGPREIHDRVRFYTKDGSGTYDDVRSVLDRVLANHPDMGVSAVLTAYCTDFTMIFQHLFDEVGARNIYMKPVNATHEKDYALNAETLPAFQQGYLALVEDILAREPADILERLQSLSTEDFFMRYFYRVKDRAAQVYRCGAGKTGVYLDTNGRLYPCAHFIGKSGWHIGHASTGIDETKRQQYLDLTVDSKSPCRNCYARYVCGGGCYYQAVLANGDIHEPDSVKCELIRFLTNLAVQTVVYLGQHHPVVLEALPSPYGIAPDAATTQATAGYLPVGKLVANGASDRLPFGGPGRVRGTVDTSGSLAVALEIEDSRLNVLVEDLADQPSLDALRLWVQPLGEDQFAMRDLAVRKPGDSGHLLRVAAGVASWLVPIHDRFRRIPFPARQWRDATDVTVSQNAGRTWFSVDLQQLGDAGFGIGLNLYADLVGGGWTALALHEPFLLLEAGSRGWLAVSGPEARAATQAPSATVNGLLPEGLLPLGRWAGLQGNVC